MVFTALFHAEFAKFFSKTLISLSNVHFPLWGCFKKLDCIRLISIIIALGGLVMSDPWPLMCLSPKSGRPNSLSTHQAASSLLYIKLTILAFHVPLPLAVGMRSWSSILATLFSDRAPSGLILSSKGLRFAALVLALAVRAFLALLTSSAVPCPASETT